MFSTGIDGFISPTGRQGFFVHQTRMLSCYRWRFDGEDVLPVVLSNVEEHTWLGYYIAPGQAASERLVGGGSGEMAAVSERSVELRLSRSVGFGVHEDVDVTNYTQKDIDMYLQLEIDADFADQTEAASHQRKQIGELKKSWGRNQSSNWELLFDYVNHHHFEHQGDTGYRSIHRRVAIEFANCTTEPSLSEKIVTFHVVAKPFECWHACIRIRPHVENQPSFPLYDCYAFAPQKIVFDQSRQSFLGDSCEFTAPGCGSLTHVVVNALEQAKRDLASLRLHDLDQQPDAWVPAAGIPVYVALFGRDTLTASWEAALLGPEMMQGTLPVIANLQGTVVDDWRDEQPGRMLHEAHTGPLACLGFNPRSRYYGSATTSGFYPVVLTELWHWTGDKDLIRPLIDHALGALRWKDEWADIDSDGFYEYLSHSTQGVKNQGWKDSGDAIVYEDGTQVKPPIATCEEQAFVYVSKLHMAEMLWWLDRKDEAKVLYRQAAEFKKRFNEVFWVEEIGTFALGLDPQKRPIKSVASNPGHCVACGVVDDSLVERTVNRLMADDMYSGWGVRTLAASHPAFNPYSYHRGAVWPVEHGSFAMGFMRYGLFGELRRMARGIFDAAAMFDFYRLPEVFSGHPRDERHPLPALYPKANWPQAWSASAIFTIVQCLLGIYPYAPLHALFVNPQLPEWLPEITLNNLRVGKAVVSLRFYREQDGSSNYQVQDKRGTLHIARQPSPWSMTSGPIERVMDALASLLPGK